MELCIYLWVEDMTVFIRELLRFFRTLLPDEGIEYAEEYDRWENGLDRHIGFKKRMGGIQIDICDYYDISYVSEEYGTNVNVDLWFNIISYMYDESSVYIAEMVNWIMKISDTDLAIEDSCNRLIFKRMKGKVYYAQIDSVRSDGVAVYDPFPIDALDFDRDKAVAYTQEDEWVFCSEEDIRSMREWEKKKAEMEALKQAENPEENLTEHPAG